jgi:acetyl esterase
MPLDPQARRLLALLRAGRAGTPAASIEERRERFAALMRLSGPAEAVASVEEHSMPGPVGPLRMRVYTPLPQTPAPGAGLLYFHGGGFVAGDIATHDALCRSLANAGRLRLVALDYRLAPEHAFPAALVDCYRAALWARRYAPLLGIDPRRLGIGGDSAGASLAAIVCRLARDAGAPRFALQLLLCPITDFSAPRHHLRAADHLLDGKTMAEELAFYLPPGIDPGDPRVSPLKAADLSGLPPALIHTAEGDPLRDEGEAYAERLRTVGVETRHTCHPGMIHLFYAMTGVIPYARAALERIGIDLRAALAPAPQGDARSRTSPVPKRRDRRAAAAPAP